MSVVLSDFHAVLLDLDGTLYHEDHALPGGAEFVARLLREDMRFACLSNSTASPKQVATRLARMGMEVAPEQIYTAAAAAADLVLTRYRRRPRIFNLATEGIHEMLDTYVDWVQTGGEPCDAVVVGAPCNLYATEERQRIAVQLLRKGAELVGICADRVFPSPRGLELGAGALAWMLAYAANVEPVFTGKPQRIFLDNLCNRLGVEPHWCLLIGDNLESDVAMAKTGGMRAILVLTGVTRRRDLLNIPAESQPDMVVEDLTELV